MVRNQLSFISAIQLSICTKFNLLEYLCVHYLFNECKLDLALSVLYFDNLVYNPSLTIFHLKYKICLLTIVQRINRLIHTSSYSCDSRPYREINQTRTTTLPLRHSVYNKGVLQLSR